MSRNENVHAQSPKPRARCVLRNLRVSPTKLNQVAGLIRNMSVDEAVMQLVFSKKRIAGDVKKCLNSAAANAENNLGLDVGKLVIDEVLVGKSFVMKRSRPRARGRAFAIHKFFSNITIILKEAEGY